MATSFPLRLSNDQQLSLAALAKTAGLSQNAFIVQQLFSQPPTDITPDITQLLQLIASQQQTIASQQLTIHNLTQQLAAGHTGSSGAPYDLKGADASLLLKSAKSSEGDLHLIDDAIWQSSKSANGSQLYLKLLQVVPEALLELSANNSGALRHKLSDVLLKAIPFFTQLMALPGIDLLKPRYLRDLQRKCLTEDGLDDLLIDAQDLIQEALSTQDHPAPTASKPIDETVAVQVDTLEPIPSPVFDPNGIGLPDWSDNDTTPKGLTHQEMADIANLSKSQVQKRRTTGISVGHQTFSHTHTGWLPVL